MKNWLTEHRFILSVLGLVVLLRIPAIPDGLPAVYNPTEYFLAKIALSMGARFSPDPLFYMYPPFYSYLLLGLYGIYFVLGRICDVFPDQEAFAVKFLVEPDSFYMLGRSVSLIFLLLILWITYKSIRKYRGENQARLATGLTAGGITYMLYSASATPEMVLVFWSSLAILSFLPLRERPTPGRIYLAGFFAGLAAGTKYNAGFLVVGLIIFMIVQRHNFSFTLSKGMRIAFTGILCGFFIPNFHIFLLPGAYLTGLKGVMEQMYYALSDPKSIFIPTLLGQLIKTELILGILFTYVIMFYLFKRFKREVHLLLPLILTVATVISWSKTGLDYLLPIYPICIFLSTEFIVEYFPNHRSRRLLLAFIFIPLMMMQLIVSVRWIYHDTREQATRWLMSELSPGDRLCYDQNHYDLGLYDIERFTEYGAGAATLPSEIKRRVKSIGASARQVSFIPILYEESVDLPAGFLYEQLKYVRKPLERLLEEKIDFLVINDWYYQPYLQANPFDYHLEIQSRIRAVKQFYLDLSNYTPIVEFIPDFWHNGPKLSIYRFKQYGEPDD